MKNAFWTNKKNAFWTNKKTWPLIELTKKRGLFTQKKIDQIWDCGKKKVSV